MTEFDPNCSRCPRLASFLAEGRARHPPGTGQGSSDRRGRGEAAGGLGVWLDLPTTKREFIRIDDLDEKIGALDTLLLDKANYLSMVAVDGACMGCGEKTVIHLFTAAATALMQPRVKRHVAEVDELIGKLETHIRLKLAEGMDLSNPGAVNQAVESHKETDLTLADLSATRAGAAEPVDQKWLRWVTQLLEKLRHLNHSAPRAFQPLRL